MEKSKGIYEYVWKAKPIMIIILSFFPFPYVNDSFAIQNNIMLFSDR